MSVCPECGALMVDMEGEWGFCKECIWKEVWASAEFEVICPECGALMVDMEGEWGFCKECIWREVWASAEFEN